MNTNIIQAKFSSTKTFWLIIGIALLSVFLKDLPFVNLLFGPFQQFETLLHEMSHALACVLTGGSVSGLTIVEDGNGHGGLTFTHGGIPFIYSQAGYIGEALWGCLLIALSRFPKLSRILLMLIGVSMGLVTLWFMPGALFLPGSFLQALGSIAWGLAMAAGLFWLGKKVPDSYAHIILLFIAVQSCLSSLQGVWVLLLQSMGAFPGTWSDATNMQRMTGMPAWFWGISWAIFSIGMLSWTMWMTYKADNKIGTKINKEAQSKAAIKLDSSPLGIGSSQIEQELLDLQQGVKIKTTEKSREKQRRRNS